MKNVTLRPKGQDLKPSGMMMTGASIMETESHDKFFTIFEESPFGNKIINSDLRIIKVNKAMIELLGYGEHEILGKRITDFSHPNFKRRWRVLQRKLWSKKVPVFTMETGILRKDSSILWCQVTSILIADRGETLGYTIVEDISERKALEDLRAEADTSKDEMLNILGHELRTPLAALKSINQLMELTVDPQEDVYRNILKSGLMIKRMERLVQDLLDVPSIQSGKFNLVMTEFNFQDAVQESISSVQQISPSHKIILERSVNVIIKGDQFRLEQV
ncbi:MAG TPA: PAS domain S-box protein, partial [Sphingobacteriaceae bacterium]